ncbi:hypothetical protein F5Y15DRAFT_412216 [Xylariaceae sp. FL0016]|nr:hypothetical protein F5Y15DRAFT_412216 [Xylariaceae sp. FL0016]
MQASAFPLVATGLISTVLGQAVTGPFAVHVTGTSNASLDGYACGCHAGAMTEGLCLRDSPEFNFFYNQTQAQADASEPD